MVKETPRSPIRLSTAGVQRVWLHPIAFLCAFVGGLALGRWAYEVFFPHLVLLAQPMVALALALLVGGLGYLGWRWLVRYWDDPVAALAPFPALLITIPYLLQSGAAVRLGSLLLFGAIWLATLLLYTVRNGRRFAWLWLPAGLLPVYLLTMGRSIGQADTFEFQVVIPQLGIVHPTGYPLYMLLGRLFSLIPVGPVAWRINLASVVFALGATLLIYLILLRLTRQPVPAVLGAAAYGLTPTFWSQAIVAEVYALHALLVAAILYTLLDLLEHDGQPQRNRLVLLAFLLGLGLTNHLTTLMLVPGTLVALFFLFRRERPSWSLLLLMALAFLGPLLLYSYLPLRWAAVNDEPMGWRRFLDWVIGGRFQGALRLDAWLRDPTRYAVVGRLLRFEWEPLLLLLPVPVGFVWLFRRRWHLSLVLLVSWLSFAFYALSYYVPDLSVFLLPTGLITSIWWGAGLGAIMQGVARFSPRYATGLAALPAVLAVGLLLWPAGSVRWAALDRSQEDGRQTWAEAVLAQPIPAGAAILADSVNFPPLYYLQQAVGMRPDLDIVLLPDEAAYRAELNARLSAGQPVYLGRYLPGLEGTYHLRSAGPLTEVSMEPLDVLPPGVTPVDASMAIEGIRLLGYRIVPVSPYDPAATALTLYWQASVPVDEVLLVYLRWAGDVQAGMPARGRHPANDDYPTVAWEPGEIVSDFHLLPRPILSQPHELAIQVALAPPFTPPAELAWKTVASVEVQPPDQIAGTATLRAQVGPVALDAIQVATQVRPETPLPFVAQGYGIPEPPLVYTLRPTGDPRLPPQAAQDMLPGVSRDPYINTGEVSTHVPAGKYSLFVLDSGAPARCGWMQRLSDGCPLAEVSVAGVALPAGAVNFADKVALLEVDLPDTELVPGAQLPVTLHWQALDAIAEDYTVFVQVLDEADRIVGQVDSWPMQGTYPTSQWRPGEQVQDTYRVQLESVLAPGRYRLVVGWYLLETLERLPVLDENGTIIEDKVVVPGLSVAEE